MPNFCKDKEGEAVSSNPDKLYPMQEKFCREYIIDFNGKQSAIRAGYSEKGADSKASQLLALVKVQERIAELQEARIKRSEINADYVLNTIKEVIDDGKQKVYDKDGNEVLQDKAAVLKGCELLGKHLAMWTDKKLVDSTVQVTGIKVEGVE